MVLVLLRYSHWQSKGAWQTEADFSGGTLRLIGLLWALLDGNGPLLLEEPELSLHAEIARHIPEMMASIQKSQRKQARQILVSTHSSDLLSDPGIAVDEVLLLRSASDGTKVEVGKDVVEIQALLEAGLPLAEAVMPHTRPPEAEPLSFFVVPHDFFSFFFLSLFYRLFPAIPIVLLMDTRSSI